MKRACAKIQQHASLCGAFTSAVPPGEDSLIFFAHTQSLTGEVSFRYRTLGQC